MRNYTITEKWNGAVSINKTKPNIIFFFIELLANPGGFLYYNYDYDYYLSIWKVGFDTGIINGDCLKAVWFCVFQLS